MWKQISVQSLTPKGQINGSLPTTSTSLSPDSTIFATEEYRFDIYVEIRVNYSINSTFSLSIDESIIEYKIEQLIKSQNLNNDEYMLNIDITTTNTFINIQMSIQTDNNKDVDDILVWINSDEFTQSIESMYISLHNAQFIMSLFIFVTRNHKGKCR